MRSFFFFSATAFWRSSLIALVLALQGCANLADITKDWSNDKLYAEAKDELNNGAFDKAIKHYEKLESRALGTPLGQQAQVEKAYVQYKAGSMAETIATIDRFMRLHPASPLVDYALYLRGLANFNGDLGFLNFLSRQKLEERDQKASKESYASFAELARRFPDSKYTADAQARMAYILNTLASYELHVARYYFNRSAYVAAINRAQLALTDYPNSIHLEEALSILIESYQAIGSTQLRDDTIRVMAKNFPKNKLVPKTTGVGSAQKP